MDRIDTALKTVERAHFLPKRVRSYAGFDVPINIGHGQTNCQPTTVNMMLHWLDPKPQDKVLDVGSGSGWTTALLANLVGLGGTVYAVERHPDLVEVAYKNCREQGITNAYFFTAEEGVLGLRVFGPYDRILVSAAAHSLPIQLLDQLRPGGRIVLPLYDSILVIDKLGDHEFKSVEHYGFSFVPLVQDKS